jgi:hypothetical protein
MNLFGLQIERNVDVLALIGFIFASAGGVYQIFGALKGHEAELFPPRFVLVLAADYPNTQRRYLRVNARMAYVNTGQPGYNAVVTQERVRIGIGKNTFEQVGFSYESFRVKEGSLASETFSDAEPFAIQAASSISHETYFGAATAVCDSDEPNCNRDQNFLPWDQFLILISENKSITFEFLADVHNERPLRQICVATVDDSTFDALLRRKFDTVLCVTKERDRRSVR